VASGIAYKFRILIKISLRKKYNELYTVKKKIKWWRQQDRVDFFRIQIISHLIGFMRNSFTFHAERIFCFFSFADDDKFKCE
jgi:hypothetical protein